MTDDKLEWDYAEKFDTEDSAIESVNNNLHFYGWMSLVRFRYVNSGKGGYWDVRYIDRRKYTGHHAFTTSEDE